MKWPDNSVGVLGPDELAAQVRKKPYSIGYVDFSYAVQTRMTFAAVDANAGYLMPSMSSIGHAIELQNFTSDNLAINTSSFDNSSYPLVGLYYASWQKAEMKNATMDFVSWIIGENTGQQTLSEVQYPAIYRDEQSLATYADQIINGTVVGG